MEDDRILVYDLNVSDSTTITPKNIKLRCPATGQVAEGDATIGWMGKNDGTNVSAVLPIKADDSWWTVGSSNTVGEPSSYSSLPSRIQYPRAIKFFVLCLTNSDGTRVYASTTIPAYGYGTSRTTFAHTEYLPQTGSQGTYTAYRGYCDINFANMSYKVWVSSTSYYAILYCFY